MSLRPEEARSSFQRAADLDAHIDRLVASRARPEETVPSRRTVHRILACLGESEANADVLSWSAELARLFHADVTLIHVTRPIPPSAMYPAGPLGLGAPAALPAADEGTRSERVERLLRDAKGQLVRDVPDVTILRREGHPGDEIVRASRELASDLIVVGHHEGGALDRLLVGSTTDHVKNHAQADILIVRGPANPGPILAGVDGSAPSRNAAQMADEIARRWSADLHLLRIVPKARRSSLDESVTEDLHANALATGATTPLEGVQMDLTKARRACSSSVTDRARMRRAEIDHRATTLSAKKGGERGSARSRHRPLSLRPVRSVLRGRARLRGARRERARSPSAPALRPSLRNTTMPIRAAYRSAEVPFVSVLDEHGELDQELDPRIPDADLRELYRTMLFIRAYDDRRLTLQRQGRIGTFAPVKGQEAAQLGSAYALRTSDWVVPAFRETAAGIWRGMRVEDDLLYCAGREEGIRLDEDTRDLPITIPVASQLPHAVGIAWARKLQATDDVVLVYFGDGATSEGDFHEAMNFASVLQLPVVFLCQNNQWAISVPRSKQTRSTTLAQKAIAYEMPGVAADGNDLLAMVRVTREAVERARKGEGPTLIEAVTYRLGVHTTADDPSRYRSEDEVKEWEARDPIVRLRKHLRERGLVTEDQEARWAKEHDVRIRAAVRALEEAAPADPQAMFDHVLSAVPPRLERQRASLRPPEERPDQEEEAR